MIRLLLLLAAFATAVRAADTVEGANVPRWRNDWKAVAHTNCAEASSPAAAFVEAQCWIRLPDFHSTQGYVTDCFCRYHDTDRVPGRLPGLWVERHSRCDPGQRATVTEWVFNPYMPMLLGGDSGCDDPGPACTPNIPETCPTE